jgi:hypothetical protein
MNTGNNTPQTLIAPATDVKFNSAVLTVVKMNNGKEKQMLTLYEMVDFEDADDAAAGAAMGLQLNPDTQSYRQELYSLKSGYPERFAIVAEKIIKHAANGF